MVETAQEISEVKRHLARVREELARIEYRIAQVELKIAKPSEEERIEILKNELKKAYPNMTFTEDDLELLKLVGILPYNPPSMDSKVIAEAIAKRFE